MSLIDLQFTLRKQGNDDAPPSTIRGVYTFPGDGGNLDLTVHPQGWVKFRVGWGDGTADTYDATWTGADDTQTFTHHYGSLADAGSLPVSVSFVGVATEHGEGKTFDLPGGSAPVPYPPPSGTPSEQWPAPQVVKAGDPVDITATYSNEPITNGQLAYVNWDGADWATKLMGAIFDGSGSITAHFDHAPLTTRQPQIFIYADGVGTNPYPTTDWGDGGNGWSGGGGVFAQGEGGNVYVRGATIGNGSNDDVLVASDDGKHNLQAVYLVFPHPDGEAETVTLTTTNATEDDLWATSNPGPDDAAILGGPSQKSSYTFTTFEPSATFYVGATAGSTTYDVLHYNFSVAYDEEDSTPTFKAAVAAGTTSPVEGSGTSNGASQISMTFETVKDAAGNPILPDGFPTVVRKVPTNQVVNPPTQPPPSLVKVDFIYPANGPAGATVALSADGKQFRFWDSPGANNLILGDGTSSFTSRADKGQLKTLYAQMVGDDATLGSRPVTFSYNAFTVTAIPKPVSLSLDNLRRGDPNATIPVDYLTFGTGPISYGTVHLNLPPNLMPGTTVTITLKGPAALWKGQPGSLQPLIVTQSGPVQASWTVGDTANPPPSLLYLSSGGIFATNPTLLVMTVAPSSSQTSMAKPVSVAQPIASGYGYFNFRATMTPDTKTLLGGSEAHPFSTTTMIEFHPLPGYTARGNASEIRFIQLAKSEVWDPHYLSPFGHEFEDWHVDRKNTDLFPLYALKSTRQPWTPALPAWKNFAEMEDEPAFDMGGWRSGQKLVQVFETAAVVSKGADKGKILGVIWWGAVLTQQWALRWVSQSGEMNITDKASGGWTVTNNGKYAEGLQRDWAVQTGAPFNPADVKEDHIVPGDPSTSMVAAAAWL